MSSTQERWATVATCAVVVAVMAATWLMCEGTLGWRETFRLEDLVAARGQDDDFEAYRPGGVFESGTAWAAAVAGLVALVLAVVAGVRAGRWRPVLASALAVCCALVVLVGTALPFGPFALLLSAVPVTLALRSLSSRSSGSADVVPAGPVASHG